MIPTPARISDCRRLLLAFLAAPGRTLDSAQLGQYAGRPTNRLSDLRLYWLFTERPKLGGHLVFHTLRRRLTLAERRKVRAEREAKKLKINAEPRQVKSLSELAGKTCRIIVKDGRCVFASTDGAWWAPVAESKGVLQLALGV